MRSTVLVITAATLPLLGCPSEEEDPPTTTTEAASSTGMENPATEDGGTTDAEEATSTGEVEDGTSTGEGEGSTGEEVAVCPYEDPGWQIYEEGIQIPHWELETHDGEPFNVCEYYDTPIFLDVSAMWCQPCQAVAAYLAGNDEAAEWYFQGDQQYLADYAYPFRDMIDAGCIKWVTVIVEDEQGMPPTDFQAGVWDTQYYHPEIPVIADPTGDFLYYMDISFFPSTFLINNDFTYLTNDFIYGLELVVDNLECDLTGM